MKYGNKPYLPIHFSYVTDWFIEQKHTKDDNPSFHLEPDCKDTKHQGLHNMERGQQAMSPLLCSHETPHAVLGAALEPSAQETSAKWEQRDHEDDQRDGELLRLAERTGDVQPGKEKIPGRPSWGLSVLKGSLWEWWGQIFSRACISGQWFQTGKQL